MSEREGGPAFPVPRYVNADGETCESRPQGMSLRDWFAGQAAAAMLASSKAFLNPDGGRPESVEASALAKQAYRVADAMLRERAKGCP